MSKFYLKGTTATEPKPNATVQPGDTPDFGAYGTGFDADLIQGVASAATNRSQVFIAGSDDALHWSESISWVSFPLAAGSTGSGAFTADIWADCSAVPLASRIVLKCALFKWNANDSSGGQIGTTQVTGVNLSTTVTQYTFTFTASANVSYSDGDRFYIECWFETRDGVSLGDSGIYTDRVRYNSATRPSSFTVPGTQVQLAGGTAVLHTAYTP